METSCELVILSLNLWIKVDRLDSYAIDALTTFTEGYVYNFC
ncbi:Uncharacterised protein [Streptococcus pseudoporcinus]|uniref:Uncharacterized protein n=1 Tax=Streptococcus pseudoporcinus TaxID=361101 RepID=A0A4U9XU21_9STRE|nr:Uncharacterised protein [Streptococcus pseudoporcinus]VUC68023.1 Uncharacterised protein [Streptococcus pseudoporcinus]VUC98937.1 Uncharacterised protein [Streptococcus pseudoporcinus]VUC99330.1 Uncharacterised protein [Streptococcus pseudoporcinus]